MKDRFKGRQREHGDRGLRLAGIDLYWIVAIGLALVVLRLMIWLLAAGGLIGAGDAAAAFLIALPAAVVMVAWFMPIDRL